MPPTAGLQDICAIRSRFMVTMAVLQSHARAGPRRFASRVPGADHNYVVFRALITSSNVHTMKMRVS
jgi:hypothetical protein